MITDAANAFADALLAKSKEYDNYAKNSAVSYASSDDKNHQASYKKYCDLSEIFRKLHGEACQAMHAIEAEMKQRIAESKTEATS